MLNKEKYKNQTNSKQKQNTQVMPKKKNLKERKESDRITWSFFPSTPWKNLSFE